MTHLSSSDCDWVTSRLKSLSMHRAHHFVSSQLTSASFFCRVNKNLFGPACDVDLLPQTSVITNHHHCPCLTFCLPISVYTPENWPERYSSHCWAGNESWMRCPGRGSASPGQQKEGIGSPKQVLLLSFFSLFIILSFFLSPMSHSLFPSLSLLLLTPVGVWGLTLCEPRFSRAERAGGVEAQWG